MLISIIIPIYNVEKYIANCLESVYQQTYQDIEVILVNDCTPDSSMEIAKSIADKYKNKYPTLIINHEQNKGVSESRNSGMKVAKGDYIYFIDSDDEITPNCIELLTNVAIKHRNMELIEGMHTRVPFIHENHSVGIIKTYSGDECKIQALKYTFAWNILFKRSFIQEHSISFFPNIFHEDKLFRFHIIEHLSYYATLAKITYFYRTNESGITNTISPKHIESLLYILSTYEDTIHHNRTIEHEVINNFCQYTFHYWSQLWRSAPFHHSYYKKFTSIIKFFIKRHYKDLNFYNFLLLSPALLPYKFTNLYVKIIWRIKAQWIQ